jgi:hypothetical protein
MVALTVVIATARLLEDILEHLTSDKSDDVKPVLTQLQISLSAASPHAQTLSVHYSDKHLGDRGATILMESIVRTNTNIASLVPFFEPRLGLRFIPSSD